LLHLPVELEGNYSQADSRRLEIMLAFYTGTEVHREIASLPLSEKIQHLIPSNISAPFIFGSCAIEIVLVEN